MTARKNNWGSDVVYFDHRLFYGKKLKKARNLQQNFAKNTFFFKFAPKRW